MDSVISFILLLVVACSKQECDFSNETFACKQHDIENVAYEFHAKKPTDEKLSSVIIAESDYDTIEHFFDFLDNNSKENLNKIGITKCKVKKVEENAFEQYTALKILDLSDNELGDMTFVKTLPPSITELYLKNNNFVHMDDVFTNLKNLNIIDLSFCKLDEVDFTVFSEATSLEMVNVSHNNVQSSMSKKFLKNIKCVDISYNNVMKYDNIPSFCLDFSNTNMTGYRWYNVSENNATVFIDTFYYINNNNLNINATNTHKDLLDVQIGYLNISEYKGNVSNIQLTKVKVTKELILKDSNIPLLRKTIYDFKDLFYQENPNTTFDLSNNSIAEIDELYFEGYDLNILNLCYNHIKILKVNVFQNTRFGKLLLCHSNIENIDDNAFSGMTVNVLKLSHNKLNRIYFLNTVKGLQKLDLSYNMITFVTADVLSNFQDMIEINLSNNLITSFDVGTFTLTNLREIDFSNNNLTIIKSSSFMDIPNLRIVVLEGNRIQFIERDAFKSLPKLTVINLSNLGLENLQESSFTDLPNLEVVYLNNNNIRGLPTNLFTGTPNLRSLYLYNNEISSLTTLGGLNLDVLDIKIGDDFKFGSFISPQLKTLYITGSNIETVNNSYFLGLYNLKELRLKDSVIVSMEPNALKGLFRLQYLDPQIFNKVTVLKQYSFKDLMSLQLLNLTGLHIEVIEPETFYGLTKLEKLYLNDNNIVVLNENVFIGLGNVRTLDMSGNNISKLYVNTFAGLDDIRKLILKENNIFSIPLGIFQNLRTLEVLDLARNGITHITVGTFSELKNLKYLDLSYNHIQGICQAVLFPLNKLEEVYLTGNYLQNVNELRVIENFPNLKLIEINRNEFVCEDLILIFKYIENKSIAFSIGSDHTNYETPNINGIMCKSTCLKI